MTAPATTTQDFRALGRQAREAGRPGIPAGDRAVRAALRDGNADAVVADWLAGWASETAPAQEIPAAPAPAPVYWNRDDAIKAIRASLKTRSDRTWSVKGGRGSDWGWITVTAPPARRTAGGSMTAEDAQILGDLLGLDPKVHHQGASIPASSAHYAEYVDRAAGRTPAKIAAAYWD